LDDVVSDLTDMPALPTVVARLTRLIADPKTTASDINHALLADPGLVTKILKLVNSPYYGFSRRITTITNAVVILGFNQVRNLAMSAYIFDAFARRGSPLLDVDGLWRHSIGVAFMAAKIAKSIGSKGSKMEEDAFICGLLHDLGKFIMNQKAPEHLGMVMETVGRDGVLFFEAEKLRLGYDHAELGALILEKWNLPRAIVDVVRCHHNPMSAPRESLAQCCAVWTADVVSRALLMGNGGDGGIPRLTPDVWRQTGLDWKRLEDIIRKVAAEYSKSDAFFSAT
jgi:putative nucleotidyltransferase with HDIG domain